MKKYFFLILALIFLGCNKEVRDDENNKYKNIVTKYTEIKELISKEVNDTFYVYVRLPKFYNSENKRYPVLYLLDGDISFNMAVSIVRYLQFGKDIPDLIIVAPAYGTLLSDEEVNYRERDYTISEIERFVQCGGGNNYLRFIKNELIPLIVSSYRTNEQRILNGYSLGGLFAVNTLLTEPDLFDSYIAGSPYLIDDLEKLITMSNNTKSFKSDKKLFITVGELEDKQNYHKPINYLFESLKKKSGLEIKFSEFENGTHFTSPPEALTYGLKFIYNR